MDNNTANATKRAIDFDELYPARFLKAGQLQGKKVTLKICDVHVEHLEGDAGKKWKGIISFERTDQQLVLNRTNGTCLREMFGREVAKWIGRRITIYPAEWNGEPCIRIWGSPELERDKTITIQLPRRKPQTMVMHAVRSTNGKAPAKAASPEPQAAPPQADVDDLDDDKPDYDPRTGEVHTSDDPF
jgi:hypothetical protein